MLRFCLTLPVLAAVVALAGCSPPSEPDAIETTPVATAPSPDVRTVTLAGLTCGDNCYLDLSDSRTEAQVRPVLCTARACWDWRDAGGLPPSLKGTQASARFGRADQVDGSGTIVTRDVEAVIDVMLPPPRSESLAGASQMNTPPSVPARFQGLFAPDKRACAQDYTYNPAFQNVTVTPDEVRFFETGGPITHLSVNGDAAALTLRETVGETTQTRAIFLSLNADGTIRYRASESDPVQTYVRCPS